MEMAGSEHPDGCIRFGRASEDSWRRADWWDNKSTETAYTFPPSHLRQFKRYIRGSSDPVACFLVRCGGRRRLRNGQSLAARSRLRWHQCRGDRRRKPGAGSRKNGGRAVPTGRFNLEVINMTGILSRPLLEQRMRLFL